jgi:hypothetical protein
MRIIRRIASSLEIPSALALARNASHGSSSMWPALRFGVRCSLRGSDGSARRGADAYSLVMVTAGSAAVPSVCRRGIGIAR